ncbi:MULTISPECIES: hypothetical protein [unclassified Exiguobacterium]|uniref:hypothetical protein n=1 Tax=unclassified Exiguobacterium TaxID=2644629 RepID=UPI001BEA2FBE|nr:MULTISPECIES: hypothetical protein [unclassified Exiguobacterium]
MKNPVKVKLDYFFERNKTWFYSVIILLLALLTLYIFFLLQSTTVNMNISASMIGIFGAILGAIVGGVLTLFGSIYVNNNQMRSKSAIQRKNIIYKPLYDELIEVRNILNESNPYPTYVTFTKGQQTIKPHPQFSAWGRIKNDSRYIQTPRYLSEGMEELYEVVIEYLESFPKASDEIQNRINELLYERHKTKFTLMNLSDILISGLILKNNPKGELFKDYFEMGLNPRKSLTEEEIIEFENLVYEECHKLNSVKQLIESYNKWIEKQDNLINMLSSLIKLISMKYEKHNGNY